MGLKDKLGAAKRWMWSPMTVWLLERGSDTVVISGQPARLVVDLEGSDDGTVETVEVSMRLNYGEYWPLGEVPATLGRHELEVRIPEGLQPSSPFTEYLFRARTRRTAGNDDEAVSPVHVISRVEDLYWPDGPRAQGDSIALDVETLAVGETLTGRAPAGARLVVGPFYDMPDAGEGKTGSKNKTTFKVVAEAQAGPDGRFAVEIPVGPPPTLTNGDRSTIVWQVRVGDDWHLVGVHDPEGQCTIPKQKATGLLDLFT